MEVNDEILDAHYHDIGKMITTLDAEVKLLRNKVIPLDYERMALFVEGIQHRIQGYMDDIVEMIERVKG